MCDKKITNTETIEVMSNALITTELSVCINILLNPIDTYSSDKVCLSENLLLHISFT